MRRKSFGHVRTSGPKRRRRLIIVKKGDSLQLSSTWWATNKPDALPETGMGAALREYEKYKLASMSGVKQAEGLKAVKALLALKKVETARLKGISHCVGPFFYDTKAALQKTAALTAATNIYVTGLGPHVKLFESAVETIPSYLTRINNQVQAYNNAKDDQAKQKAAKEVKLARERLQEYTEVCKDAITMMGSAQLALGNHAAVWTPFTQARTRWKALETQTRDAINATAHFTD
jgi:hypothetical protein